MEQSLAERIEEAVQALKNTLQVVVIDLEKDDDAQVIFETLNARGEPLLPADLLRNYIFLRAGRLNEPQEAQWRSIATLLESYLLRRAVLGWTTKAYNRIFLHLAKTLKNEGLTMENLSGALSRLRGESTGWPSDGEFSDAWLNASAYERLNSNKIVHILRRLSENHLTARNERIKIESSLSIEHILPQEWVEHWPLPNGEKGFTQIELWSPQSDESKVEASKRRNRLLHTFGNLTLITQALNSSVSNSAWSTKKPALLQASLLPINQQLHEYEVWREDEIQARGKALLKVALKIWPGPIV